MSEYKPTDGSQKQVPYDTPAERKGMSGCAKAALIIGGLGVVSLLVCCVGGFFYFRSAVVTDPVKVNEIAKKIITWDFNDELEGQFGVDMFFARMALKMDPTKGMFMVADSRFADAEDAQAQFEQQIEGQLSGDQNSELSEKTTLVEKKEHELAIKGKTIKFVLNKTVGEDSQQEYWEVTSLVPGNDHTTFLLIKVLNSAYSEQDIVDRLQSIR